MKAKKTNGHKKKPQTLHDILVPPNGEVVNSTKRHPLVYPKRNGNGRMRV